MIDVFVLTALNEELNAVLDLHPQGAAGWRKDTTSNGFLYYAGNLPTTNGRSIDVVAAVQHEPGPAAAAFHTTNFLAFEPRLAAMVGICAGRRAKGMSLGDVLVAHTTFRYDVGKQKDTGLEPEIHSRTVFPVVRQWLQDFEARGPSLRKLGLPRPPPSLRYQRDWVLLALAKRLDDDLWPRDDDRESIRKICPQWTIALQQLQQMDAITIVPLRLTAKGLELSRQMRLENLSDDPLPDPDEPAIRVGALATGSSVAASEKVFAAVAERDRTALALDMEGSAFLDAAAARPSLPAIVVKGVADFGDKFKDDHFHAYACMGAAKVFMALVDLLLPQIRDDQQSSIRAIIGELENYGPAAKTLFGELMFKGKEAVLWTREMAVPADQLAKLNLATVEKTGTTQIVRRTSFADALKGILEYAWTSRTSAAGVSGRQYPVALPRPAQTLLDRKLWYAYLRWPVDEESWFEASTNGTGRSGIQFYPLEIDKFLVEVLTGMGAYQGNYMYYYLDETSDPPSYTHLKFRTIYSRSESLDDLTEYDASSLVGLPDVTSSQRAISVFTKGRGLGDYGALHKYEIEHGNARLVTCRLAFSRESPLNRESGATKHADSAPWHEIDINLRYKSHKPD